MPFTEAISPCKMVFLPRKFKGLVKQKSCDLKHICMQSNRTSDISGTVSNYRNRLSICTLSSVSIARTMFTRCT
ncbi:hypothetical protein HZ326_30091 [Fusarium oxysporum f. sp. albedinis]|nr:hypothetical protein HZ326_30091 [Fusarium oxysporum f. sp. albedinis]